MIDRNWITSLKITIKHRLQMSVFWACSKHTHPQAMSDSYSEAWNCVILTIIQLFFHLYVIQATMYIWKKHLIGFASAFKAVRIYTFSISFSAKWFLLYVVRKVIFYMSIQSLNWISVWSNSTVNIQSTAMPWRRRMMVAAYILISKPHDIKITFLITVHTFITWHDKSPVEEWFLSLLLSQLFGNHAQDSLLHMWISKHY